MLRRAQPGGQLAVDVAAGALAHPRNQAGQHRDTGQHHAQRDQVRGGQVKQDAGPHGAGGHLRVEPAREPKRLCGFERGVAQVGHYPRLVFVPGAEALAVGRPLRGRDVELRGQRLHDDGRHLGGVGQEGTQKA
ncbi:hypothetical protein HNQ93_004105 [Hymenobacter luteus]|uniref:Uncharacterized protein n=2 Tax=Hymenobacter TaxID=89966 RepID=A0A7W9T4E5_9BACT|nr:MULTISPECIES: hypothetical protein [Hymenobacter]MBB4603420.1 hypothetical protein [Hymenobacter latericoloratus]MBB6061226.1 hypothetical protein [Hymenobacter luteus]